MRALLHRLPVPSTVCWCISSGVHMLDHGHMLELDCLRATSMAAALWRLGAEEALRLRVLTALPQVRYGHHMRGKPPGIARSLAERLEELQIEDPSVHFKVDIGLPVLRKSRKKELQERLGLLKEKRNSHQSEELSRTRKLRIDLDEVKNDWKSTCGQFQIKEVAEHYGIYDHLYGDAYFVPQIMLDVAFHPDKESAVLVHRGNVVKPAEAKEAPSVQFDAEPDSMWTLVMTNLDGHFTESDTEYLHWFKGNIRGNDISSGEDVCPYLQPFAPKGTGYHRFVFVLYKQECLIDFSKWKKPSTPCVSLSERTFKTLEFYRELQDSLTPAGLAFFQSDWDSTLKDFFHNILQMEEPTYEYDFPKQYVSPQKWFPKKKPFNLYLDKYKDPRDIQKELLLIKLKELHPFRGPDPRPKYPNAFFIPDSVPSWLKNEMSKERLRLGKYRFI